MKFPHRSLLTAAFLVLCATIADAQVHLYGRVIEDGSQQAIAGATVELQTTRGRRIARQVTNDDGEFRFVVTGSSPVRLQAERIGYRRATTPLLEFTDYTLYSVEVRLGVAAVPLAPLEVVGRSRSSVSPTLAGFELRRLSGPGWFMTREEIERRKPNSVTSILAMAPGVSIRRRIVYMSRAGTCPAQIYVDGFHINRTLGSPPSRRGPSTTEMFPIDDMVQPGSVEGIEVYQGLSRVPAEFLTPQAVCGVVAIWTRRGGERRRDGIRVP